MWGMRQKWPSFRSLLYWDHPYLSAFALVTLNCIFWLVVLLQWRPLSMLSTLALLLLLLRTWSQDVWPCLLGESEQRSPVPDECSKADGLRQSDLVAYSGLLLASVCQWGRDALECRRSQPLLFCLSGVCLFSALWMVGTLVSGVVLTYLLMLGVTLGPGLLLHVIPPQLTHFCFSLLDLPGSEEDDLKDFIPEASEESLSRQFSLSHQEEDDSGDICHLSLEGPLTPVGENQEGEALEELLSDEEDEEEEFTRGLAFPRPPSPENRTASGFELISEKDLQS